MKKDIGKLLKYLDKNGINYTVARKFEYGSVRLRIYDDSANKLFDECVSDDYVRLLFVSPRRIIRSLKKHRKMYPRRWQHDKRTI